MAADITVILGMGGAAGQQIRSVMERLRQLAVLVDSNVFWIDGQGQSWRQGPSGRWHETESVQDDLALLRCDSATYLALELSERASEMCEGILSPDQIRDISNELRLPPSLAANRWRLVVPIDGNDFFHPDALPGWSTIVGAPENRFSDSHPPAPLKISLEEECGDYFGHAAAQVATIAGLWRNDSALFFDEQASQLSDDAALTLRVFSRAVVGIDVGDNIIDPLLDEPSKQWPLPQAPVGAAPMVAHPAPEDLVESALQQLGTDATFRYQAPGPYNPPRRTRISILDALRIFWARLRGAIVDLPTIISVQAKEAAVRSANTLTAAITGIGAASSQFRFDAEQLVAGRMGSTGEMLERVGAPVFVPATPSAWRNLRSLCFGLVDGDPSSIADTIATVEGRRTVIVNPNVIGPAPVPPSDGANGLAVCDIRAAKKADASHMAGNKHQTPSQEPLPPLATPQAEERRSRSLLWRLGAGIHGESLRAALDVEAAFKMLATSPEESPEIRKARKQLRSLRRRGRTGAAVVAVALAFAGTLTARQVREDRFRIARSFDDVTLASWISLAAVLAFMIGLVLYIREELRIRFRLDEYYRRLEWAHAALPRALSEVHRLGAVYEQFLDWSSTILSVVHRPWGRNRAAEFERDRPSFEPRELPHSTMVVFASAGESRDSSLRVGVEGELTRVGWIGRSYTSVSRDALAKYALERRRANDDRLDPDEDVPTAPSGTRAWLAAQFIDGLAAQLAWTRARRSAISYLLNLDPVETLPELDPGWHPPELLDGLSTSQLLREPIDSTPTSFDQDLFTAIGQQRGARGVERSWAFVPPPLRDDDSRIDADDESTDLTLVSARVDVSGATPKTGYAIFSPQDLPRKPGPTQKPPKPDPPKEPRALI